MQTLLNRLIPFVLAGMLIVALAFGMVLLAYIFMIGALVGLSLYLVNVIRQKFFPPKNRVIKPKPKSGRVIDSNDWKEL
jgi:hypothetical protein